MKKILAVLVFVLVLTLSISVFADYQTVVVYVNGELLVSDSPAVLVNSRTMVPLRAISEKLGCDVGWDDKTQTAEIKNEKTAVYVTIDSDIMVKKDIIADKSEEIKIDAPAMLYKQRTLIPLRAVSEALDAKVDWDAEKECALITTEEMSTVYGNVTSKGYKSEETGIEFDATHERIKIVGYNEGDKYLDVAETVEEVDAAAMAEFGAYYEGYGANLTFITGPKTTVKPEEFLEYFKSAYPTNQGAYVYIPALKLEDVMVDGVDFKKLGYIVQNGEEKLNMDYRAGTVNGRMIIIVTLYTDAGETKTQELLNCIKFN